VAEDVTQTGVIDADPAVPVSEPPAAGSREDRARRSAYRSRFAVAYLVLAVVAGAAVGSAVVILATPDESSSSRPSRTIGTAKSGEAGAIDIADQVQRLYRKVDGKELVNVVATRNILQDGSGGYLRVRFQVIQPGDAVKEGDAALVTPRDAIQYSLCGAGARCTISGGPSVARGALLRREALELAVRTLQRDRAVENVAVFLSPIPAPQGSSFEGYVYVFDRASVQRNDGALLSRPIDEILPGAGTRMTPAHVTEEELTRIDELTRPYLYLYTYQVIGGRDALLQLQPTRP
jgi:hypothetical protein